MGVLWAILAWTRLERIRRPYIGDQIAAAEKSGGISAAAETMVRLLKTDHLNDQLAALTWLRKQSFVQANRIAVAGTSFGGIEAVLGAERGTYCAAIDSAGGAQSWAEAPALQSLMAASVRNARAPIFFFQAENDYDLSPSKVLSAAMKDARKPYELKIYPPMGLHAKRAFVRLLWIGCMGRGCLPISRPALC